MHSSRVAQPGEALHRQERMASQLEEIVMPSHLGTPQELPPERGDLLFIYRARGGVAVRVPLGADRRGGQSPAVEFPARGQRQRRQLHVLRWHHDAGEFREQELAQSVRCWSGYGGGHDVGHELGRASTLGDQDRRLTKRSDYLTKLLGAQCP